MKKLAFIEMFVGALIFAGTFIVGELAVSAIILMAWMPMSSKKIKPENLNAEKLFKANNLFSSLSVLALVLVNLFTQNSPFASLWLPLAIGGVLIVHGTVLLITAPETNK